MQRFTVRAFAACAAFVIGLASVWLSGLLAPAEEAVAEWLAPTSGISVPPGPLVTREKGDTRKVYETVLREMFGGGAAGRLLVVGAETADGSCGGAGDVKEFEGASGETLADYNSLRDFPKRLSPFAGLRARLVLLPEAEFKSLFRRRDVDAWEEFGRRFPDSTGFIRLSAVGFNRAGDEAFLYAERSCGWLCGDGWHVLLRKTVRGWEVEEERMVWVS